MRGLAACLALGLAAQVPRAVASCEGYARDGVPVVERSFARGTEQLHFHPVRSPDGRWSVGAGPRAHDFWLDSGRKRFPLSGVGAALVEVSWSPDARVVAVNQSDGGAVGHFEPVFYEMRRGAAPRRVDIARAVKARSRGFARCAAGPCVPNWAFAAWLRGGREALVLAQVPPSSSYENLGQLELFRVSVPSGRILERADSAAIAGRWARFLCAWIVDVARGDLPQRTLR